MSARRDVTSGLTTGIAIVAVIGAGGYLGWRMFGDQIVAQITGIAGAAGSAAGEEASHQITTGVQGAAPGIGAAVGSGAVEGATSKAGQIFGGSPAEDTYSGPVTIGGTPVDVTA